MGVNPVQDARTGTVDLEYTVEEKPSDRLELSGGWGAGRLVLSLGLSFTNFSMRNIAKPNAWQPLPAGDGQTLNLRAQTNGRFFQSYSMSFVEPWLGGHKQNSLSLSLFHSVQTNGKDKYINTDDGKVANPERQSLLITGGSVGLGKRLPGRTTTSCCARASTTSSTTCATGPRCSPSAMDRATCSPTRSRCRATPSTHPSSRAVARMSR
ncbi:MAG: hypothetical protein IPK99_07340 [Flavobacteriales bacterium]|nr:hypothetical protein [Flavobacteriales bacterium]